MNNISNDGSSQIANSGQIGTDAQVDGGNGTRDNTGQFNVNDAVQSIQENAEPHSTNKCAQYVTDAVSDGGIDIKPPSDGGHAYAKDYGPSLEAAGFQQVANITHDGDHGAVYPPDGYVPQPGDIVVMDTYPTSQNQAGHMAMYTGQNPNGSERWVSDFVQPQGFWPGPGYRGYQPSYAIYRYPAGL